MLSVDIDFGRGYIYPSASRARARENDHPARREPRACDGTVPYRTVPDMSSRVVMSDDESESDRPYWTDSPTRRRSYSTVLYSKVPL